MARPRCRAQLAAASPSDAARAPVARRRRRLTLTNVNEFHDAVHQTPRHDDARHDRHPRLRHRRVPAVPVSDLPNVDFPTVTVSATLPGTSPQTMAATVATPLEKQFSTIAGIDNMTSTSSLGQTQIVIQFALDRNIDAAAQDVQAAIAQTRVSCRRASFRRRIRRRIPPTRRSSPSR